MLQQHLAQVDRQSTTAGTAAGAGVSGKDAGQSSLSSRSSRSLRTSTTTSSSSRSQQQQQQQRGTLTSKLLHHQSKLEQALTSASSPSKTPAAAYGGGTGSGLDATQGLAAGIESGGGAALMSNFAALATSNRQLPASLATDSGQHLKSS